MRIALTGKGGVGKTLLSDFLLRGYAKKGFFILVIGSDPDTNQSSILYVSILKPS
jgi:CO dehydrogenase maturation factor